MNIQEENASGDKLIYMTLSRMQMDNAYYLKHPCNKHLYMCDVPKQIKEMKRLWLSLKGKPDWLKWEEILDNEKQMMELYNESTDNR
mgnify:CR=1 FL=1